jgi:hypothetical protein
LHEQMIHDLCIGVGEMLPEGSLVLCELALAQSTQARTLLRITSSKPR